MWLLAALIGYCACVDTSVHLVDYKHCSWIQQLHAWFMCIRRENVCGILINRSIGDSSVLERAAPLQWINEDDAALWSVCAQLFMSLNSWMIKTFLFMYEVAFVCVCVCVCASVVCHRGEFSAIWALLSVSVKEPHYFICYSLILHNGTHIDGYLVRTVINALSLQYQAIGF